MPLAKLKPEDLDFLLNSPRGEKVRIGYRHNGRTNYYEATFEGAAAQPAAALPRDGLRVGQAGAREVHGRAAVPHVRRHAAQAGVAERHRRRHEHRAGLGTVGDGLAAAGRSVLPDRLSDRERQIGRQVLKEIRARLGFLADVGLDYLTIDRTSSTLSGGEAQRIRLATQIGSSLMGVLYILDEPTIGLHQKDNAKLIATLVRLRDLGNTLIVVEHDEETIRTADWVVDIGPGAGEHGGEVIASGPLAGRSSTRRARSPARSCAASARCPSRRSGARATASRSSCASARAAQPQEHRRRASRSAR